MTFWMILQTIYWPLLHHELCKPFNANWLLVRREKLRSMALHLTDVNSYDTVLSSAKSSFELDTTVFDVGGKHVPIQWHSIPIRLFVSELFL